MNETPKLRMRWTQLTLCALLLSINCVAGAQQFNADNQWVAPYGVGTVAATTGEEYSTLILVAAFVPEWEFNLGVTHYDSSSDGLTESHDTGTLYVKRRFFENEQATGSLAIMAGTGIDPGHLQAGEVTDTFESWWANLVYTIPFNDGQITWDLLPGFLLNLDQNDTDNKAWGMTYSSRVAIYDVIPQSAIVAEVFGTTGEAH